MGVRDVQNIADILVDPEGALEKRNHWEKTSHALLVGAILHVLYAERTRRCRRRRLPVRSEAPDRATLRAMMTTPHLGEAGPHPVVASARAKLLNKSDNERSACCPPPCRSSASTAIPSWPRSRALRLAHRRPDRGRAADDALPRGAALRHQPHQAADPPDPQPDRPRLTEDLHGQGRRHKLLLMLDEFPALGRLDFFESALAFMAGYGIRSFLIAQSLNQIEKAYGPNNSILDNCHVRVLRHQRRAHRQARLGCARHRDRDARDANYAGHRLSPWLGHLMVSRRRRPARC
jgi:type IV secretion system protein VirD4